MGAYLAGMYTGAGHLTRRLVSLILVALLALPAALALSPVESAAASPRVLVIAHRGFSAVAPENTLPAMAAAAKAHADMVEFDVQRTSDGHLIVVHDTTFARTTNIAQVFPSRQNDPVGSFTLAEVERLDAGSWMGPAFTGVRVPTLGQLLSLMAPTSTNLLLELKNPWLYRGYETQVAAALATHHFIASGRVDVHSFDRVSLDAFHQAAPTVPLGLLTKGPVNVTGIASWMHSVNPEIGVLNDAGVDQATKAHLQVFTWPDDKAQGRSTQIERMVDDGVSGIITDDPVHTEALVDTARGA
jgi:glycerophosphoryl diester phosphodiesterase